jgi:predicted nucleic acid-binding protein
MSVFVDTSAFLAVLDADDANHKKAARFFERLRSEDETLVCSSYILVETFALLQHRFGIAAVRTFQEDFFPLLKVEWVERENHLAGVTGVLAAARRRLSLVDCVSFDIMRRLGIKTVFAFDPHFGEQGFDCRP